MLILPGNSCSPTLKYTKFGTIQEKTVETTAFCITKKIFFRMYCYYYAVFLYKVFADFGKFSSGLSDQILLSAKLEAEKGLPQLSAKKNYIYTFTNSNSSFILKRPFLLIAIVWFITFRWSYTIWLSGISIFFHYCFFMFHHNIICLTFCTIYSATHILPCNSKAYNAHIHIF